MNNGGNEDRNNWLQPQPRINQYTIMNLCAIS